MFPYFLLFLGGGIITAGDILIKKWIEGGGHIPLAWGVLCYMLGIIPLIWSYFYKNIAIASLLYIFFNILLLTLVSWLWFHEPLSPLQIAGMLLGLIAIVLLELG